MSKYRTAMGKTVDMSVLTAKNEKTRAVGNMKVNARGDTIDALGRIVQSATSKVNDSYNRTVGNRSAQPVKNRQKLTPDQPAQPKVDFAELNEMEREIEESFLEDLEIEHIKAQELKGKK